MIVLTFLRFSKLTRPPCEHKKRVYLKKKSVGTEKTHCVCVYELMSEKNLTSTLSLSAVSNMVRTVR